MSLLTPSSAPPRSWRAEPMKLMSIEIEGFGSFRDHQRIDLDGLDLVIGVGENGAGKSTLLVHALLIAFYGKFQSATIAESITTGAKSGSVSVEFTLHGDRYRVQRTYMRAGSSTAAVHVQDSVQPLGWLAITEKGARQVTETMTTLIGMDYSTAAMTWIAEQGQYGKFSGSQPSQRFELLSGVFGLDTYASLARKAKAKAEAAANRVATIDGRITELTDAHLTDDSDGTGTVTEADLTTQQAIAQTTIDAVTEQLAELNAADPQQQVTALQAALSHASTARTSALAAATAKAARANAALSAATARAALARADTDGRWERASAALTARANAEIVAAQGAAAAARTALDAITAAQARIVELTELIEERETDATAAANRAEEQRGVLADLAGKRGQLLGEFQNLAVLITDNTARVQVLTASIESATVDPSCYACGQHLNPEDARLLIQTLTAQTATHRQRQNTINAEGKAGNALADLARVEQADATVGEQDYRRAIADHSAERARAEAHVNEKPTHERAIRDAARAEQAAWAAHAAGVAEAQAERTTAHERVTAEETAATAQAVADRADAEQVIPRHQNLDAEEVRLTTELAAAQARASADSAATVARRAELTAQRETQRQAYATVTQELSARAARAAARAQQEARLVTAKAELATAKQQHLEFSSLFKAYSPTGIPAMILGGLLADLNDAINQALSRLSCGELTVQLRTSRDTGSAGDNKIHVYVQTRDDLRSYETLSGGQAFRVDVAIRIGLADIIARGTGTPVETFLLDEGWGSLDAKGIASTASVLDTLSQTTKVITVSHIEGVQARFASTVDVSLASGTSLATVNR
ncbi:hypothetical protein C5C45_00305 [Rathayibacter rathayi]|uniref:Nuclease SbcCD subunit C n=3 Tax=Rathayibacter rathayi TaxID=33887 RepID=A0ABX5AGD0_RATRA|nr:hypothetical protein C5C34_06110 [Rathayibacter rathayi]PPF51620.1 hypothetical protein C5C08_02100 [Rathayibacter rathayi]PPF83210.1 hypothetical protein C5C14_02135 [Rathayibacter rathayi]PPG47041.1 hypothetical protein C5C20_02095 [Rathayibacter rathayi]PPG96498.1 hypothetical protein C5C22_02430 [Rathayibacter rathayi]